MSKNTLKYYDNEAFKKDTFEALSSQFDSVAEFESFYSKLMDNQTKDDFLRVGSAYLFLLRMATGM